jgi:2-phosphosulfolactate phosphatase
LRPALPPERGRSAGRPPLTGPDIRIGSFEAAARTAQGAAVIIDVFRAFSAASAAFARGAAAIVFAESLDQALDWRRAGIGSLCLGERGGLKPDGFDFGNSPLELATKDVSGQTLIQTTSNGTRGVLAALNGAETVYAAAFANAEATVRALAGQSPIHLIAMGADERTRQEEDELCAYYMRARLMGRNPDFEAVRAAILTLGTGRDTAILTPQDIDACLRPDVLDRPIRVRLEDGRAVARAA